MRKERICLNGEWDFMPVYGVKACLDLPQEIHYEEEKIRVPSSWRYLAPEGSPFCAEGFGVRDDFQPFNLFDYPKEWSMAETGVYRRKFSVRTRTLGERISLQFDGIMQQSRIYLNNHIVAEWEEAYLPLTVDITQYLTEDGLDNELMVVCTTFDETELPSGKIRTLGLMGSWFGHIGRGIWQDVYVIRTEATFVADAFVKTSVRNHRIELELEVEHLQDVAREIEIQVHVVDETATVLSFKPYTVLMDPNSKRRIQLEEQWINPKLWSFETPFLYATQIVLRTKDGEVDRKDIVFGFREIWTERHQFILNGIRINLRGDSWHFQGAIQQTKEYALNWFKMCKEKGLNFVRLHAEPHPEYYLEAADEVGILIVDETAIYGSSKTMDASHPVYIDRCKQHVERLVRRDKNHPSIIMWSLQNEMRWVDGRDAFKTHIPEMIKAIKGLDDSRPVIVEGDNRLISNEETQVESYHYNIDGTLAQWDKMRPLVYGEHGGWWYICPQNFSAYSGLEAYLSWENSSRGAALKEKLYVEVSRRNEVSGITSFNFAHYLMKSMPNEDVVLSWGDLTTPGCKPRRIPKHALTLNNGYLKDYPNYLQNIAMDTLQEAYKPVTIIPVEYNTSFFDDRAIIRSFDVYNDTMKLARTKVDISLQTLEGQEAYKQVFEFLQEPGEKKRIEFAFNPILNNQKDEKSILILEAVLYHEEMEIVKLQKSYSIYSASLKKKAIEGCHKKMAFWGNDQDFSTLTNLLPACKRVTSILEIDKEHFDLVIIGSHANSTAEAFQRSLERYVKKGGCLIVLEQTKFAIGDLTLFRKDFFSAQINDASHKVLAGLKEEDFCFWKPDVHEEYPEAIIESCYNKPASGDVEFILEASAGDFGDGGSLWSPLFSYRYGKGTMILNQLELMAHFQEVPQACMLLRNILKYGEELTPCLQAETAVLADLGERNRAFLEKTGLCFEQMDIEEPLDQYKNLIIDANSLKVEMFEKLSTFAHGGGTILVLPVDEESKDYLERLLKCKVEIEKAPVYQLRKCQPHPLTSGLSIFDLFRFEKVNFSPRLVENVAICDQAIEIEGAQNLLESNHGTPWYDFYVREILEEFVRVASVDINKINKKADQAYLVQKQMGQGSFIFSQISTDLSNEKNVRVYSRLLSNAGAWLIRDFFSYIKSDRDYAMPYLMTINHEMQKNYLAAEAYFSDVNYSLNNLGEGVYGWMKKVEKENIEGYVHIPQSKGVTYFTTSFVNFERDKSLEVPQPNTLSCQLEVATNASLKIWVNGVLMKDYSNTQQVEETLIIKDVMLLKGLNRFVLIGNCDYEDIKIRPVFKSSDGSYLDCLKYTLTMDEVDPK
ncbi:MAG: beta-galactosidase [Vallitaleaceae bacterium]|nr:beta-galactosidase [Vallitaleaceae bacterium]